jgi:RNA polymerase sigma-70 factor (ECF subfamily)
MAAGTEKSAGQRWSEMMAAAQTGDGEVYRTLLEEIMPGLRAMVRARVFDPAAAEDVVQNVLLSLHRARHTYRPERPFRPWLNAIARNAIVDSFREGGRRREREVGVELIDEFAAPWAEPIGESEVLSPELAAALERLPDKQREAVQLMQVEGLSVVEAAARAGVTSGALKVRAHRGYRALRKALRGAGI